MNGRVENDFKIFKSIENNLVNYPDYITDWYYYLKANDQSATTCRDYINKVKSFLQSINEEIKDIDLKKLNEDDVVKYFIDIQYKKNGEEISDSYKQGIWSCLNNFFDFLKSRNMIETNLLISSKIKRPQNKDLKRINNNRRLLTTDDFNKILCMVDKGVGSKKAKGYQEKYKNRDKCIMLIFMTTGIRKTALSEINIEDINFDKRILYVTDKGHIVHDYYLNDDTIKSLKEWMYDRSQIMNNNTGALFISKEKKRMCGNSITKLVDKYAYAALGYHITPHKLRSGLASIMYEQTGDIEFVRRVIGHSNVSTTQRYIVTDNKEREKASDIMLNLLNQTAS